MVQVPRVVGAGVIVGCGPAPRFWFLCSIVAQVDHQKPHLRHKWYRPAPGLPGTCANPKIAEHVDVPSRLLHGLF